MFFPSPGATKPTTPGPTLVIRAGTAAASASARGLAPAARGTSERLRDQQPFACMRTVVDEVRIVEVSPLNDDQAEIKRRASDAILRVRCAPGPHFAAWCMERDMHQAAKCGPGAHR